MFLNQSASFTIGDTWVDGQETVDSIALRASWPQLRAANFSLESFYLVVSARTGASGGDRHAVSGVHVQHCPKATDLENWEGLRQPFTPPPASPPWSSLRTPLQQPATVISAARLGAISFGAALACTLGLLASAAAALQLLRRPAPQHKRAAALDEVVTPECGEALLYPEPSATPSAEQQPARRPSGEHMRWASSDGKQRRSSEAARGAEYDVVLLYRRIDGALVDSLYDKLRLSGLRVFKAVDGFLAGRPCDAELVRVMRATPVFGAIVTLPGLRSLAAAAAGRGNALLAELLLALCLRDAGAIRLIHPLLVGPETGDEAGWSSLLAEPSYEAALAALPDAPCAATVALVDAALRNAGAGTVPPHVAALTVQEVLARVLGGAPFALACQLQDLGLYLSRQYVPPIWDAVRGRLADARSSVE